MELFYRESWRDPRLQYDRKLFKNKTELALHESYTNFLWFVAGQKYNNHNMFVRTSEIILFFLGFPTHLFQTQLLPKIRNGIRFRTEVC